MIPAALRNRHFARLWFATTISGFGSNMTFLAMPYLQGETLNDRLRPTKFSHIRDCDS